jgi:hypothetical protein
MWHPRLFLAMTLTAGAAAVLAGGAAAATQTTTEEIVIETQHPCTLESVVGDGRVHIVITTTTNPDGSMHVRTHQRTHGTLVGVISGDQYVFNNGEDIVTDETIFGSSGRVITRLEFIHQGEDLAFLEEAPGLDDAHERVVITFTPLGPPTVERDQRVCR